MCRKINKTYTQTSTINRDTTFYLYSENRQVFLYEAQNNSFRKLYDFNLNTGDTLPVARLGETPPFFPQPGFSVLSFAVIVDSTSNYETNGLQLRVQHTSPLAEQSFYEFSNRTIEHIGNTDQFFGHPVIRVLAGFYGYLVCYSENGQVLYGTPDCISTGIAEETETNWSLYPNPNDRMLNIRLPNNSFLNVTASITDLQGRTVLQQIVNSGQNEVFIQLNPIAAGTYLLHLQQNGKHLGSKIFVKQ